MIAAEMALPALIYINRWFLRFCGNDILVYCPNPSSPFLPDPHTHASPSLDFNEYAPHGTTNAATNADAFQNLLNFIKI